MIEETYPSGRKVQNTLNADGELSQVRSKKNANSGYWTYADSFSYNSAGAVTKMQLGNGRWETAQYDTQRLQVTQIGLGTTDSTQNLLKMEFKYTGPTTGTGDKNNGSMREQKITVPAVGSNPTFTATQAYTYDGLNRLKSATENISTQTWKQTFDYDRYGNRRFDAANTTTLGSCAAGVCNPEINTSDNRLKKDQIGGTSIDYDYDAGGALIKDFNGQRFGYDAESHQKEFFHASNSSSTPDATYHYDGDGKRVKKIVGTEVTIFVYDASGQLAAEYSTTVVPSAQAKVSYLTTDHLGSPRIITDQNGAVISRKDFAAFGDEVVSSQRVGGTNGNGYDPPNIRLDYTGYQKDGESGLEYAQARYYNTQHGRFTSVDPLTASATIKNPQTFNRYTYVLNSPYKFTDPLGLMGGVPNPDSGIYLTSNPVIRVWNRQPRPAPPAQPPPPPVNDPSKGPATATGGTFSFKNKEFKGGTDAFGNVVIDVNLDQFDAIEQAALTGVGLAKEEKNEGFTVSVDIDLGSEKNVPVDTVFAEKEVVQKPGRINADGSVTQPVIEIIKVPVVNSSSLVDTSHSNISNVRVSNGGNVNFVRTESGSTTAVFRGTFNYNPDPNRSSSFRLSVVTKRRDYRSPETSNMTVRLNLISKSQK